MANNYREREGGLHRIFTPTERGGGRCMSNLNTHTHTHREREREREREGGGTFTSNIYTHRERWGTLYVKF